MEVGCCTNFGRLSIDKVFKANYMPVGDAYCQSGVRKWPVSRGSQDRFDDEPRRSSKQYCPANIQTSYAVTRAPVTAFVTASRLGADTCFVHDRANDDAMQCSNSCVASNGCVSAAIVLLHERKINLLFT